FVEYFLKEPDNWLRCKDAHFRDQTELLVEDSVPYTRIYEIGNMKTLLTDLSAHLRAQGHSGELNMPKANPTLLRPIAPLFRDGVREQIEEVYRADFERFGHLWDFHTAHQEGTWTETQLSACETEATLGRRIAELHKMARN